MRAVLLCIDNLIYMPKDFGEHTKDERTLKWIVSWFNARTLTLSASENVSVILIHEPKSPSVFPFDVPECGFVLLKCDQSVFTSDRCQR